MSSTDSPDDEAGAGAGRWREYPNRRVGARRRAARGSIGAWPGERDGLYVAVVALRVQEGGAAEAGFFRHLRAVWNLERERVVADGADAAVADLAFASRLAGHVAGCEMCAAGQGAEWLVWACGRRRGLRLVVGAALREQTGRGMPRAWEMPGARTEALG